MQCPSKQSSVRVVVRVRPGYHEPIAAQNTSDRTRPTTPTIMRMTPTVCTLELFRLIERSSRSPFSRAVLFFGRTLQRVLTTREPRSEHLDLASRALLGVVESESVSLHQGKVQPRPGNQPTRRSPS
jgi:hypothetical protein